MSAKFPQLNAMVRERIDLLGLRAQTLAETLGVSHTTVYSWINTTTDVPTWLWRAVEDELGMRPGLLAETAGVHPGVAVDVEGGALLAKIDAVEDEIKTLREALLAQRPRPATS